MKQGKKEEVINNLKICKGQVSTVWAGIRFKMIEIHQVSRDAFTALLAEILGISFRMNFAILPFNAPPS
jgi:hypothetical protein